ncbi:MAG: protein kinase [Proteobacteria bacterium]|nr:protein kinase [Pseudomonadota bacterium]
MDSMGDHSSTKRPGNVLAGRFVIEERVSAGGMGNIYRALDLQTSERVALKLLRDLEARSLARFLRESALLATIRHPGIVRYVAHGRSDGGAIRTLGQSDPLHSAHTRPESLQGTAYLAMEWLEGEDLDHYLNHRRALVFAGTATHVSTVAMAAALRNLGDAAVTESSLDKSTLSTAGMPVRVGEGAVAESGPSTVDMDAKARKKIPPGGVLSAAETVTLARRVAAALAEMHRRGLVHRDIKPGNLFLTGRSVAHVKVLDLGVVRSLDGKAKLTHTGQILGTPHYMAPEQARAGQKIGPAADIWALGCVLYECLTGMRPFQGRDLLTVLTHIVVAEPTPVRLLCPEIPTALADLIMRALRKAADQRPGDGAEFGRALDALEVQTADLTDRDGDALAQPRSLSVLTNTESRVMCMLFANAADTHIPGDDSLRDIATPLGAEVQRLANGILLATVSETPIPGDQAARNARVALALHSEFPDLRIALATGRSHGGTLLDTVITQVRDALRAAEPGKILLDEATASLLDARFDVVFDHGRAYLAQKRDQEETRTLLGKPGRWVGRRRELALLTATFEECADEHVVRTVLVTGSPGMGKSRLREEFVRTLRRSGDGFALISGHGDPLVAGSPFAVLAPSLRRLVGIRPGDDHAVQRDKLRTRLAESLLPAELDRVASLLGEMIGLPRTDSDNDLLRAAHRDPQFLSQVMERAWLDFLSAETMKHPVLVVVDDLHWSDRTSVRYIDAALDALAERPLMVLALSRPEVEDRFPQLWAGHEVTEIALSALSTRASAVLVRNVLGEGVDDDVVCDLVAKAGGNAFYLEELIRMVVSSGPDGDELPDSIVGMVHVRLDALGSEAKRILRAGSIYGESSWPGGVEALLGGSGTFDVAEWMEDLAEREILHRVAESRFPGEREYQFRHALIRDGAYALLTESDRQLGHALAGTWLELAGEADSLVLAEHFMRGDDRARAIPHLCRAAENALEANDLDAAAALARRAIDVGASGEMLGVMLTVQAAAYSWISSIRDAWRAAEQAMLHLEPGSARWYVAAGYAIASLINREDRSADTELIQTIADATCREGAENEQLICLCRASYGLVVSGHVQEAEPLNKRIVARSRDWNRLDERTRAQVLSVRGLYCGQIGQGADAISCIERAVAGFERASDPQNTLLELNSLIVHYIEQGDFDRALVACERAIPQYDDLRIVRGRGVARAGYGYCLAHRDQVDRGRELLGESAAGYRASRMPALVGMTMARLAQVEYREGEYRDSERSAAEAIDQLGSSPNLLSWALAVRARALVALGQNRDALELARRSVAIYDRMGNVLIGKHVPLLALAESLDATGDRPGARQIIVRAAEKIEQFRVHLTTEGKEKFAQLDEVKDTLALQHQWKAAQQGSGD